MFGLVLVVGIVGELMAPWWNVWIKRFERLVLIGVAGELIADGGIFLFSSRLQAISDAEVARLNSEAGHARESAEGLRQNNLVLQSEILKLREKMADRHLTVEQQRTIPAKLQKFKGQRLNMLAFANDSEVVGIANDILGALNPPNGAGWIVSRQLGQEFGLTVPGIGIEIEQDADPASVAAGQALLKALTDERFSAERIPALPPGNARGGAYSGKVDPQAKIRIIIGKKP